MSEYIDYHDYVFKNGKLVGKFDEMYKNSTDIPWHQDKTTYALYSDIPIVIMKKYNFKNILDIGCGLGYFTNRLVEFANVTGIDVSKTAIEKAKIKFSDINFLVEDITSDKFSKLGDFDLIICNNILWYIFEKLDIVIENINKNLINEGYLFIIQSFPDLDKEFAGKKIIKSPEKLKSIFSVKFNIEFEAILQNHYLKDDGPIANYLFRKGKIRNPFEL